MNGEKSTSKRIVSKINYMSNTMNRRNVLKNLTVAGTAGIRTRAFLSAACVIDLGIGYCKMRLMAINCGNKTINLS